MALLVGELRSVLDLDTSKYDKGLDRSHAKFGKFVKGAAVASAAAAVAAGAGLLALAKGAAEDEKAQAILAKTLKNTAGATDAQVASIEAYITKTGVAKGVTDDQMRPALANLVRATHDVGKAQDLMGLAMDVSAGTGKDLGAVTMALAKAQNGSVGGLAKLGIATKDASGKTKSFEQIQKDLAKTFTGQSAAAAETTSGKYARLRLIMAEAGETIGAKVLPVLLSLGTFLLEKVVPAVFEFGTRVQIKLLPALKELGEFVKAEVIPRVRELGEFITGTLVPGLVSMGEFVVKNKDFFVPFAATLGVILAAVKAWTIAQAALNIVLAANPIGLVVIALAGLVAGLIYAYKHSEKFREIVERVGVAAALTFVGMGRAVLGLVKIMMPALKFMTIGFLDFVGGILAAAAKVDNALGGKLGLQKASDAFNKFKETASTAFDAATAKAGEWDKGLAATQKNLILKANIQDLESKLRSARKQLGDKNLTKERRAQIVANIKDLEAKLKRAKGPTQLGDPALTRARIAKLEANKKVLDDRIAAAKLALRNPQLTATKKAKLTALIGDLQRGVNAAQRKINSLKGKTVPIEIKYTSGGVNLTTPSSVGRKALGGPIHGPGGPTDDRAGLYALSDNEHVWTAKEVAAAGGHSAVEQMRKAVLAGRGLAAGGRPGATFQSTFDAAAKRGAQRYASSFGSYGGAMGFASSQAGKDYGWGSSGPRTYDCSGFMSAITNYIRGKYPYSRVGSTGTFPWSGFARGAGAFMIGSRRGNPGHMAGTLMGMNVESRGGDGVVVGSRARGARNGLFGGNVWHLARLAAGGRAGDAPFDLLNSRGRYFDRSLRRMLGYAGGTSYVPRDGMAYLHRGEAVITADQNRGNAPRGETRLDDHTIRAQKKAFAEVMREAKFRVVGSGSGGSYILQMSNG